MILVGMPVLEGLGEGEERARGGGLGNDKLIL